jgi:acetyl-CoA acetyltransferase
MIRSGSTPEALAALKPVFRPDGTITAGNASPLNDGASAVLLGSETAAGRIGSAPLARIAGPGAYALDPPMFGYAPVEAADNALRRAGIGWADVGAVELNEAFAVQSLACIDAWGIDPEIVNVRGGAIAIGHPLGASGGRILGTLTKVLRSVRPSPERRKLGRRRRIGVSGSGGRKPWCCGAAFHSPRHDFEDIGSTTQSPRGAACLRTRRAAPGEVGNESRHHGA